MKKFPHVNATFHDDHMRAYTNVDICVAVSIDGGLITPIVKNVDQKTIKTISIKIIKISYFSIIVTF